MTFTDAELEYLATQRIGRLATLGPDGFPQNNPVGFRVDPERGAIEIGGHRLGASRKWANIVADPKVSFVVDDIESIQPWHVRGIEIRGVADPLTGVEPMMAGFSDEMIRIHPYRVRAWGLDPSDPWAATARTVR